MRRQAILQGGGLRGEMLMPDVSGEELASLLRNPKALKLRHSVRKFHECVDFGAVRDRPNFTMSQDLNDLWE
jgi:hypothetical protein